MVQLIVSYSQIWCMEIQAASRCRSPLCLTAFTTFTPVMTSANNHYPLNRRQRLCAVCIGLMAMACVVPRLPPFVLLVVCNRAVAHHDSIGVAVRICC